MKIRACFSLLPAVALAAGGAAGVPPGQSDERPISSAASAEVRVDASARPDFSGTWRLNTDLSDDPREKMREARGGAGGRRGGGGRGGMGGGGRGGMGGGGRRGGGSGGIGGDSGSDSPFSRLGEIAAQRVLTIVHKDPQLVVTDLNRRARTLFTDGRKVEEERGEGTAKIQAKWKDRAVVVVTKVGSRETTETFERAVDGSHLFLTTKIEGGRGSFSFRRVYDAPLPSGDSSAPAEAPEARTDSRPPST